MESRTNIRTRVTPAVAVQRQVRQLVDRLPPHDLVCEEAVIGCMLLNRSCYNEVKEQLQVKEAFYSLCCQVVFENLDEKTDIIGLQSRLKDKKLLEQIGGVAWLNKCVDSVPSSANLSYWLEIVRQKYLLRKLLTSCTEAQARVYEHTGEVDTLLDEFERDAMKVRGDYHNGKFVNIQTVIGKVSDRVQQVVDSEKPVGMSTGYEGYDAITGGLDTGLHIISGERSVGKTSLAFNIADHRIFQYGDKVCIISLETSGISAMTRMICCRERVDSRNLRKNPAPDEVKRFQAGAALFYKFHNNILLCQDSGLTSQRIRAICRRGRQQGATLFIVDYLQLIQDENRKMEATERVGKSVYQMKDMSKELDAPVILISGLSRAGELRNSNEADYACDTHLKLKKPENCKREEKLWRIHAFLEKGKDCGEGKFELDFYRNFFLFVTSNKIDNQDIP